MTTDSGVIRNFACTLVGIAFFTACATAPDTRTERLSLVEESRASLHRMLSRDPSLVGVLETVPGYVVFPRVGEGAFVVGATKGSGVLYTEDHPIGFASINGLSVGAQLGGQSYDQLVVFGSHDAFTELQAGEFALTADASATVLQSGAAARAVSDDGATVFIDEEAGLMAEASVGGQTLSFEPSD